MKFQIAEIQPNPFRHIDRYPIREDKIAALRESLRTTGFWDNVVARVITSTVDGVPQRAVPQIAYGHHRREALLREYPPDREVNLIVRDLSDEQMLKIMARENMEEWGSSAAVEHETVRAVVEAYGDGLIELSMPPQSTGQDRLRYAPSLIAGDHDDAHRHHPYTAQTVADFLGWLDPRGKPQQKVLDSLAALQFIEEGGLDEEIFAGLSTTQARVVVEQARRAKAASEARAKLEREQAKKAEREAAAAEKERATAEQERLERLEMARIARDKAAREKAARAAKDAERRAAAAERERKAAEKREAIARQREAEQRKKGQQQAARTGRHVSEGLKAGRGTADASAIADEVRDKQQRDQEPPEIDDFAFRLAARLNQILDPDFDQRARDLDRVLTYRQHLGDRAGRELDIVLGRIVERIAKARKKLAVNPLDDDVVDAEIVEVGEITQ